MAHLDKLSKRIPTPPERTIVKSIRILPETLEKLTELAEAANVPIAALVNAMIEETYEDTFE